MKKYHAMQSQLLYIYYGAAATYTHSITDFSTPLAIEEEKNTYSMKRMRSTTVQSNISANKVQSQSIFFFLKEKLFRFSYHFFFILFEILQIRLPHIGKHFWQLKQLNFKEILLFYENCLCTINYRLSNMCIL